MASSITATPIFLTAQDRTDLEAVVAKPTSEQRTVFRAKIVLLAANGLTNSQIADELRTTRKTVRKWRTRYATDGMKGLQDRPRSGRPRVYDDVVRAIITAIACELPVTRGLPFSRLSASDINAEAARELDPCPSRSSIAAWLRQAAIKPWTIERWVTSRDPDFEEKAAPVLDLYNGIWEGEELKEDDVIICADEKPGVRARSRWRTPPGAHRPVRICHQYKRNGKCVYQAALLVQTGEIIGHCVDRNTIKNFDKLVETVMKHPSCRDAERVFWIVDNGSAHHPNTSPARLTGDYPNIEVLHLPTRASWLNQIELYFSVLSRKALAGESFTSVEELTTRITEFEALWNQEQSPFEWKYTRKQLEQHMEKLPPEA